MRVRLGGSAGGGLCGLCRRLERSCRRRCEPARPGRGGDLARPAGSSGSCRSEAEALGLLALMLYSHARLGARRGPSRRIRAAGRSRSCAMGRRLDRRSRGAALSRECVWLLRPLSIGSGHPIGACRATPYWRDDWMAIERLYDGLCAITGSPVAAINRAIAVAQTRGPAAGLAALPMLGPRQPAFGVSTLLGGASRSSCTTGGHDGVEALAGDRAGSGPCVAASCKNGDPRVCRPLQLFHARKTERAHHRRQRAGVRRALFGHIKGCVCIPTHDPETKPPANCLAGGFCRPEVRLVSALARQLRHQAALGAILAAQLILGASARPASWPSRA